MKHYHLIGVGGVGMSAIAHILHSRGDKVSGSDQKENDIIRRLRAEGVEITIGHSEENVNGADVVVYSAAISPDNPELKKAREKGIPTLERPEMLGQIMEPYKNRIAVAGAHGKTTTTSMISVILNRSSIDSTVMIGGDVKLLGGNARLGSGSVIVTEACEAFGSFLHLKPSLAVITNIDADHLDYYGTVERVEDAFRQFANQVDSDGCIVACWDDDRVRKVLDNCSRRIIKYGFYDNPDFTAADIDVSSPNASYTLVNNGLKICHVRLGTSGMHNVLNSLAAAAVAFELGVDWNTICAGLSEFRGAERRFDILYDSNGITVIDDYAHHPSEIKAIISAARSAYSKKIIAVFQPHLYSRTQQLLEDFADALSNADEVIITSIYAAREKPIEGVSAEDIVKRMKERGFENVYYISEKDVLPKNLSEKLSIGDLVLVIGAGDIRTVAEELARTLSERHNAE